MVVAASVAVLGLVFGLEYLRRFMTYNMRALVATLAIQVAILAVQYSNAPRASHYSRVSFLCSILSLLTFRVPMPTCTWLLVSGFSFAVLHFSLEKPLVLVTTTEWLYFMSELLSLWATLSTIKEDYGLFSSLHQIRLSVTSIPTGEKGSKTQTLSVKQGKNPELDCPVEQRCESESEERLKKVSSAPFNLSYALSPFRYIRNRISTANAIGNASASSLAAVAHMAADKSLATLTRTVSASSTTNPVLRYLVPQGVNTTPEGHEVKHEHGDEFNAVVEGTLRGHRVPTAKFSRWAVGVMLFQVFILNLIGWYFAWVESSTVGARECADPMNKTVFQLKFCVWNILHIAMFYGFCFIMKPKSMRSHVVIFLVGASWYLMQYLAIQLQAGNQPSASVPPSLSGAVPPSLSGAQQVCQDVAYEKLVPRLDDFVYNTLGQVAYVLYNS